MIKLNTTSEADQRFPIPPGFVGLRRFLGDLVPPSWSDDVYFVEIHNAEADEPEPVGGAYVVDDGLSVRVVAILVPAVRRDSRVRMVEGAVRELFPDRIFQS